MDDLIQNLQHSDTTISAEATAEIVKTGKTAIPKLIPLLCHENWMVRIRVTGLLEKIGLDNPAENSIRKRILHETDQSVRAKMKKVLANLDRHKRLDKIKDEREYELRKRLQDLGSGRIAITLIAFIFLFNIVMFSLFWLLPHPTMIYVLLGIKISKSSFQIFSLIDIAVISLCCKSIGNLETWILKVSMFYLGFSGINKFIAIITLPYHLDISWKWINSEILWTQFFMLLAAVFYLSIFYTLFKLKRHFRNKCFLLELAGTVWAEDVREHIARVGWKKLSSALSFVIYFFSIFSLFIAQLIGKTDISYLLYIIPAVFLLFSFVIDLKMRILSGIPTKVARNDLCPCGSGRKYKKCCGK